jgi:hypothetical protein
LIWRGFFKISDFEKLGKTRLILYRLEPTGTAKPHLAVGKIETAKIVVS